MNLKISSVIIIFLLVFSTLATAQKLTILTEDSPPLNFIRDGQLTGSSAEVVREILKRLNSTDTIQVVPWARGYHQAQTQSDTVLFSTTRTAERENLFQWAGPLCIVKWVFYARRGAGININSLADAKKVGSIGTYKNDVREQFLKQHGFTNLDSSNTPISNIKKLLSGRIDLWFDANVGLLELARKASVNPLDVEPIYTFRDATLYIAFSKTTSSTIVKQWQATLDEMYKDGTFARISQKWLPKNSIPTIAPENSPRLTIYTENHPPSSFTVNGELKGFSVAVVRAILKRIGHPDTIQLVPWARGYNKVSTKPGVALFATTRLPQREKLFKWVGPLYTQQWGFYGKQGALFGINSLEDAKTIARIGTYRKDAKKQYLSARGFTNLVSTNKNYANVRHLMNSAIDLWVSSDFNMPHIVRQVDVKPDALQLIYAFKKVNNYIAFSQGTQDKIIMQWQKELDAIKQDGTYDTLYKQWVLGQ
ncbi:ABC transporter substrate-binding protein [Desulfococcaceae bacterium HSG9]|nr:ABC transporter substrate-binding protein [Desulfococcaceae bacterium HSG9]